MRSTLALWVLAIAAFSSGACGKDSDVFGNAAGAGNDAGVPDASAGGSAGEGGLQGGGAGQGGNPSSGGTAGQGGASGQGGAAGTGAAAGQGGVAGKGGAGGEAGAAGIGGSPPVGGNAGSGSCAEETVKAQPAPIDVYLLVDATASMNGSSGTGVVWPALTSALVSVFADAQFDGMSFALGFLPVAPPAGVHIPGSCVTDTDCTAGTGPCKSIATGLATTCVAGCTSSQDCGLYGPCTTMMQYKFCNGAIVPDVSCDPGDYDAPDVVMATLPGNKTSLTDAITGKPAEGNATPTEPALRGALTYAQQWAGVHPDHQVQVVFATDGVPNNCTTNTIQGAATAAAVAANANPSVTTYVLAFGMETDLNLIAQAGGTSTAFFATETTAGQQLQAVMTKIRANGACRLQLPAPEAGTLQLNKVNVSYGPPGNPQDTTVFHVSSASACNPVTGGWYYAPSNGTPTMIVLCPASCNAMLQSASEASIAIGCQTIVQ